MGNTKFLLMTGFEPRTSGVGIDRFTNWATSTGQERERERDNFKTFFDFVLTAHKMVKPPQKTIE